MAKKPTQPETPTRKIPDKCLRCAALSADQAKALHGVDGNGCWDSKVCPSRRSEAEAHGSALSVAHGEDISLWIEAIRVELATVEGSIELEQLRSRLNLHFIELWLGLLLGGYGLCRAEGHERFYSPIGILVQF